MNIPTYLSCFNKSNADIVSSTITQTRGVWCGSNCDALEDYADPFSLHTVTGASTRCTLDSSTRISRALKQRALTSPSLKYSHLLSRSICSSKHELPPLVNDEAVIFVVRGRDVTPFPVAPSPERWLVGITVAVEALITINTFPTIWCL